MKSIGEIIHQNIFALLILDSKERYVYYEASNGSWYKSEFDEEYNTIYYKNSKGYVEDNRQ